MTKYIKLSEGYIDASDWVTKIIESTVRSTRSFSSTRDSDLSTLAEILGTDKSFIGEVIAQAETLAGKKSGDGVKKDELVDITRSLLIPRSRLPRGADILLSVKPALSANLTRPAPNVAVVDMTPPRGRKPLPTEHTVAFVNASPPRRLAEPKAASAAAATAAAAEAASAAAAAAAEAAPAAATKAAPAAAAAKRPVRSVTARLGPAALEATKEFVAATAAAKAESDAAEARRKAKTAPATAAAAPAPAAATASAPGKKLTESPREDLHSHISNRLGTAAAGKQLLEFLMIFDSYHDFRSERAQKNDPTGVCFDKLSVKFTEIFDKYKSRSGSPLLGHKLVLSLFTGYFPGVCLSRLEPTVQTFMEKNANSSALYGNSKVGCSPTEVAYSDLIKSGTTIIKKENAIVFVEDAAYSGITPSKRADSGRIVAKRILEWLFPEGPGDAVGFSFDAKSSMIKDVMKLLDGTPVEGKVIKAYQVVTPQNWLDSANTSTDTLYNNEVANFVGGGPRTEYLPASSNEYSNVLSQDLGSFSVSTTVDGKIYGKDNQFSYQWSWTPSGGGAPVLFNQTYIDSKRDTKHRSGPSVDYLSRLLVSCHDKYRNAVTLRSCLKTLADAERDMIDPTEAFIKVSPKEFYNVLFDFKRLGDHEQANAVFNLNESSRKVVFVTGDRLSALYSRMLGNPTIYINASGKGEDDENDEPDDSSAKSMICYRGISFATDPDVVARTQLQAEIEAANYIFTVYSNMTTLEDNYLIKLKENIENNYKSFHFKFSSNDRIGEVLTELVKLKCDNLLLFFNRAVKIFDRVRELILDAAKVLVENSTLNPERVSLTEFLKHHITITVPNTMTKTTADVVKTKINLAFAPIKDDIEIVNKFLDYFATTKKVTESGELVYSFKTLLFQPGNKLETDHELLGFHKSQLSAIGSLLNMFTLSREPRGLAEADLKLAGALREFAQTFVEVSEIDNNMYIPEVKKDEDFKVLFKDLADKDKTSELGDKTKVPNVTTLIKLFEEAVIKAKAKSIDNLEKICRTYETNLEAVITIESAASAGGGRRSQQGGGFTEVSDAAGRVFSHLAKELAGIAEEFPGVLTLVDPTEPLAYTQSEPYPEENVDFETVKAEEEMIVAEARKYFSDVRAAAIGPVAPVPVEMGSEEVMVFAGGGAKRDPETNSIYSDYDSLHQSYVLQDGLNNIKSYVNTYDYDDALVCYKIQYLNGLIDTNGVPDLVPFGFDIRMLNWWSEFIKYTEGARVGSSTYPLLPEELKRILSDGLGGVDAARTFVQTQMNFKSIYYLNLLAAKKFILEMLDEVIFMLRNYIPKLQTIKEEDSAPAYAARSGIIQRNDVILFSAQSLQRYNVILEAAFGSSLHELLVYPNELHNAIVWAIHKINDLPSKDRHTHLETKLTDFSRYLATFYTSVLTRLKPENLATAFSAIKAAFPAQGASVFDIVPAAAPAAALAGAAATGATAANGNSRRNRRAKQGGRRRTYKKKRDTRR